PLNPTRYRRQSNHCSKPVSNTLKEEVRTCTALFPRQFKNVCLPISLPEVQLCLFVACSACSAVSHLLAYPCCSPRALYVPRPPPPRTRRLPRVNQALHRPTSSWPTT